jgi:hypothetical protein
VSGGTELRRSAFIGFLFAVAWHEQTGRHGGG